MLLFSISLKHIIGQDEHKQFKDTKFCFKQSVMIKDKKL